MLFWELEDKAVKKKKMVLLSKSLFSTCER